MRPIDKLAALTPQPPHAGPSSRRLRVRGSKERPAIANRKASQAAWASWRDAEWRQAKQSLFSAAAVVLEDWRTAKQEFEAVPPGSRKGVRLRGKLVGLHADYEALVDEAFALAMEWRAARPSEPSGGPFWVRAMTDGDRQESVGS